MKETKYKKDIQYYKFCFYGFFKNLKFFDPFLILFFMEKGINFLEIGILYSTREIIIMIMEIPSGVISDALGRRKTLILSFLSYILSFIVFFYSSDYFIIMSAMILFALGDSFRTGVHKAMIFNYLKTKNWDDYKVDYYGHTRSWSQTGSAVSALIAAVIVFISGNFRYIFIASVIPYLADMLLVYSYPAYLDGPVSTFSSKKIKKKMRIVLNGLYSSVTNLNYTRVLTNLSIYTGYYRVIKDYIQPILKQVAITVPFFLYLNDEKRVAIIVGIIYSFMFFISALASRKSGLLINYVSSMKKPMNLTLIIGFTIGITIGLSYYIGYYTFSIIGFILIMVIENLRKPIGVGLIANLSKDSAMATSLSITSQAKSIFTAIIAPLVGWVADILNPGTGVAIVSLGLLIITPVIYLRTNIK